MTERDNHVMDSALAEDAEVGRWLWALEDARRRTEEVLADLSDEATAWQPPDGESNISTVLYHLALIEADWLYAEVLEQDYPADVMALLPLNHRDSQGHLTDAPGFSLADHRARLAEIRRRVLAQFRPMSREEFRRPRQLPGYDVTPEWVLHHLMQHEAEHRSQIGSLKIAAGRALAQE
ncbi:MAG TPA: DinB family protein [Herpetosiphonaceae bacterium]